MPPFSAEFSKLKTHLTFFSQNRKLPHSNCNIPLGKAYNIVMCFAMCVPCSFAVDIEEITAYFGLLPDILPLMCKKLAECICHKE